MQVSTIQEYKTKMERLLEYEDWTTPLSKEQYELFKDCFSSLHLHLPPKEMVEEKTRIINALHRRGLDPAWLVSYG